MIIRGIFLGIFILFEFFSNICAYSLGELGSVESYSKGFAITADEHAGLESLFKNPAGINKLNKGQIVTSYSSWFDDSYSVASIAAGMPLGNHWTIAAALPVKLISAIPKTVEYDGEALKTGSFSDIDSQASVALGYHSGTFSTALKVDYVYKSIDQVTGSGFGVGVGGMWDMNPFTLGLSVLNIGKMKVLWNNQTIDALPQELNIGLGFHGFANTRFLADVTIVDQQESQVNVGGTWQISTQFGVHVGLEDVTDSCQFSVGTTLELQGIGLYYAFAQHAELGSIQKLGLKIE